MLPASWSRRSSTRPALVAKQLLLLTHLHAPVGQASNDKVKKLNDDISNTRRDKDDVEAQLNNTKIQKKAAEATLKTRKAELEKMKNMEKERQGPINDLKKVIALQTVHTSPLASLAHA